MQTIIHDTFVKMGILNRIKNTNITRNVRTQIVLLTVICYLIIIASVAAECERGACGGLVLVSVIATVIIAVAFLGWIIWFAYIVWTKKHLEAMNARAYKVLDAIGSIMFGYWILCRIFPVMTGRWIIPIIAIVWMVLMLTAWKYRKSEA